MSTRQPHPVFVYGTLRPGHHNHARLLHGHTISEVPAQVNGFHLFLQGVPYAVPAKHSSVDAPTPLIGTLIQIASDRYDQVLANLDTLEGYRPNRPERSHYQRVLVDVTVKAARPDGGTRDTFDQAWIYIAGPTFNPGRATLILSGDYERAIEHANPGQWQAGRAPRR